MSGFALALSHALTKIVETWDWWFYENQEFGSKLIKTWSKVKKIASIEGGYPNDVSGNDNN